MDQFHYHYFSNIKYPEEGFRNPEDFFKRQFGGEAFVDIIGELEIAKELKSMEEESEGEGTTTEGKEDEKHTPKTWDEREQELEEKKRAREERVSHLTENLVRKLNLYIQSGPEQFRETIKLETEELKVQNHGVQLLHAIGYVYKVKASEYLAKYNNHIFGIPSFVHRMRLKGRAFSDTLNTVKSAVGVHHTLGQLQQAEAADASVKKKNYKNKQ